jgi:hypothetical protein
VDDPGLLAELLPTDQGILEPGGENASQFAEYHRSRHLADELREALSRAGMPAAARGTRPETPEPSACARQFTSWLAEHRPGASAPPDQAELVDALARDWLEGEIPQLKATCSPHRVAVFAEHLRDYYQEDFARRLTALLPHWITWFAEHSGLPPHLAERCQPYAHGEPHPAQDPDGRGLNMLACVQE